MRKINVLIVEDNEINALILKKTLKKHHCVHVLNDEGVYRALEEQLFDVILMDINLGNKSKSGEEIMKELRCNNHYKHIKIYAVTSYAMPGDKERFLNSGFDKYYPKPVSKNQILMDIEHTFALT